jgi:hypothetical protein
MSQAVKFITGTVKNNQDVEGIKDFINNWLVDRKIEPLFGLIESTENTEYVKRIEHSPYNSTPLVYENQQYVEWLQNVYKSLSADRLQDQGVFYWFKPYERAVEIINENRVHLLSLEKQDLNDHSEALEFVQRYEYFPYSDRYYKNNVIMGKDKFGGIACFTKNFRNQRFWNDYAKSDMGIAFGVRFYFKNDPFFQGYQPFTLRDVFYDTGYDLDFLNELRYLIFRKYDVILSTIPNEINWMRYHYKRDKYRWENETRLSFDWEEYSHISGLFIKEDGLNIFERMETHGIETHWIDKSRPDFLTKIHFDNPFFKLEINEIICGANVTDYQIDELRKLTNGEVHVWRRDIE